MGKCDKKKTLELERVAFNLRTAFLAMEVYDLATVVEDVPGQGGLRMVYTPKAWTGLGKAIDDIIAYCERDCPLPTDHETDTKRKDW
jgi:hypothetical protein